MVKKIELGRVPKEPTWIPNAYGDWVPETKAKKSWGTNLKDPRKQWRKPNQWSNSLEGGNK